MHVSLENETKVSGITIRNNLARHALCENSNFSVFRFAVGYVIDQRHVSTVITTFLLGFVVLLPKW